MQCICANVSVPVLYSNIQSANPGSKTASMVQKRLSFRQLVQENSPAVVLLVETWLNSAHANADVARELGLQGYRLYRQDRAAGHSPDNAYGDEGTGQEGLRGGGILLAVNPANVLNGGPNLEIRANPAEDFGDYVMNLDILVTFRCPRCNGGSPQRKFAFTGIYRRPVPSGQPRAAELNSDFLNRLIHLGATYEDKSEDLNYAGFCMVGDFNWTEGPNSGSVVEALTFVREATVFPEEGTATHRHGRTLDMVISTPDLVNHVTVSEEPISDHHALIFELQLGRDVPGGQACGACK